MNSSRQVFPISLSKISDITGMDKKTILAYFKSDKIEPLSGTEFDFSRVVECLASKQEVIKPSRKIHTVWVSKGGVSKTTSTIYLSMMLALKGYKILILDLDSQLNLTNFFGVNTSENYYGISDIFTKNFIFKNAIHSVAEGIDLIPGTSDLNSFLSALDKVMNKESLFRRKLVNENHFADYDFVLIDTHSSENTLLINALGISDSILMTVHPDTFTLNGIQKTKDVVHFIESELGVSIVHRILLTKVKPKNTVQLDALGLLAQNERGHIYEAVIRDADEISNAISLISPFDIKSYGYKAYLKFVQEFESDHVLDVPLRNDLIFTSNNEAVV